MSGDAQKAVRTFQVSLVAPGHHVYSYEARLVAVPGETGEVGVMYGHVPLLTTMRVGVMHIVDETGSTKYFGVTGGFFEMMGDHATILADQLVDPAEIANDPTAASYGGKPLFHKREYASETARLDLAKAMLARRLSENKDNH